MARQGKGERVRYEPPTPSVFGNASPGDLPLPTPKALRSLQREHAKHRPKLQERLALYEDDNPRCQQVLAVAGFCFFPLWILGAVLYMRTPPTKVLSREAGLKNLLLSIASVSLIALAGLAYLLWGKGALTDLERFGQ
mmetsp:Transcript_26012/g.82171  ORF Transcript_26012/g.82171 Transcript_26012/m.82171 type:complete len:138 (+) Transcript_26012:44-457(+)